LELGEDPRKELKKFERKSKRKDAEGRGLN